MRQLLYPTTPSSHAHSQSLIRPLRMAAAEKDGLPQPAVSSPYSEKDRESALWMAPTTVLTKSHIMSDVDPERSTFPLAAYCFMTGFMCAHLSALQSFPELMRWFLYSCTVTRYVSPRSSCGVPFRRATLYRCFSSMCVSKADIHNLVPCSL